MYYEIHGSGPPLVLLHGKSLDYRRLVRQGAAGAFLIAADNRD
jgi:hypothetical protein